MSTLGSTVKPEHPNPLIVAEQARAAPLWQRIRTWWVLLPLFYFATDGLLVSLNRDQINNSGLSATQIVIGLFFWALAGIQVILHYRTVVKACIRYWILSLFAVFALISSSWSPDIIDSLRKASFLVILLLFSYFIAESYTPEEQMRLIFTIGCLVIVASYLIIIFIPNRGIKKEEWNGILGHKNTFSIYLAMYLSPLGYMRTGTFSKLFNFVWLGLGAFAIYMSQARTGWITFSSLILFWIISIFFKRLRTKDFFAVLFLIIGLTGIVVWVAYTNLSFFTQLLGKDATLTGRTEIWSLAIWALERRLLLGYGYAGFWNGLTPESNAVNIQASSVLMGQQFYHAHNAILTIALQVGLIGTTILLAALLVAFKNIFVSLSNHRSDAALWYTSILLGLCVAGSDESMFMNYYSLMTLMLVTACIGINKLSTNDTLTLSS